jgi:hypothetical protein
VKAAAAAASASRPISPTTADHTHHQDFMKLARVMTQRKLTYDKVKKVKPNSGTTKKKEKKKGGGIL